MPRQHDDRSADPETPKSGAALDPVDEKLIRLLTANGRAAYAELGAGVDLSGDAVRERLKRLIAEDVIQVVGSIPAPLLGLESFALLGITVSGPALPIARALNALPAADLVVQTAGVFDIVAELVARDDRDLLRILDESVRTLPGVAQCLTMQYLSVEKYEPAGSQHALLGGARQHPPVPRRSADELDEADRALIRILQRDGRASYRQLAEESGVPYAQARRRVLRLLDNGLVQIVTITNQLRYGHRVQAGVGVRVQGPLPEVVERLRQVPEIDVVAATIGPYDLLLEVSCADRADLYRLTGSVLRGIPGVLTTETFNYIDIHKLPYTWSAL